MVKGRHTKYWILLIDTHAYIYVVRVNSNLNHTVIGIDHGIVRGLVGGATCVVEELDPNHSVHACNVQVGNYSPFSHVFLYPRLSPLC